MLNLRYTLLDLAHELYSLRYIVGLVDFIGVHIRTHRTVSHGSDRVLSWHSHGLIHLYPMNILGQRIVDILG